MDNETLRKLMYKEAGEGLIDTYKEIGEIPSGEDYEIIKEIVMENVDRSVAMMKPTTYTETTLRATADKLLSIQY